MAYDKVVDSASLDSKLTQVADAIRTKGNTSADLQFPSGFISAIQAIQTGTELKIIVSVTSGATVTAAKGSKVVSGTSVDGTCTLTVPEAGTWSVSASLNGQTSETVSVSVKDSYALTLLFLKDNFADNDWSAIIAACHSGSVPSTWVVGNSKTMQINGASYQIDIIGKNHDTYTSGGTAPLTFQMHDLYNQSYVMNVSSTNKGGWKDSAMRATYLPTILALMPTEIQNGIREVNKLTSAGRQSATINTTADKLFLLSEIEIFGSVIYSFYGEGTQYDYYKAGNSKVKKNERGNASQWWERSPTNSYSSFCVVLNDGVASNSDAFSGSDVAFGFCF